MKLPTLKEIETFNSRGWKQLLKEVDILLYTALKQDDDCLIIVDGEEGSGKSKLMRILAYYVHLKSIEWGYSNTWTVNNIHFDLPDYIDFSNDRESLGEKGTPNVLDESRKVASRKAANTKEVRRFTDFLSECRGANQVHIVGLPAFHDLDSNIVLWRARLIIHVVKKFVEDEISPTGYSLERGNFRLYSDWKKIKNAYYNRWKYVYPQKADSYGKFPNLETIDIDQYQKKKTEFKRKKYGSDEEQNGLKDRIVEMLDEKIPVRNIVQSLNCTKQYVYDVRNSMIANSK